MTSIYKQAAADIFHYLNQEIDRFDTAPTVTLSFMEIAGDTVSDLLNGFTPTQLRASADGSVHAYPITEPTITTAEELMAIIQHGLNIRTTAATGVHDTSSRSHAILKIYIQRKDTKRGQDFAEGCLTLVDLAGSEHRIDSMYHGKERRKETSYINASLMALKECIRSRSRAGNGQLSQHVYRKSKLTMALKSSFFLPHARTIVIATVSPASKDTEHSLNTLRHACLMNGQDGAAVEAAPGSNAQSVIYTGSKKEPETRFITGGTVTTEQIGQINISAVARKNNIHKKQHGTVEELKTSNGNALESKQARDANKERELTDKEKVKLRRMSEAKSFSELDPRIKDILKQHRKLLGNERQQMNRIQTSSTLLTNPVEDIDMTPLHEEEGDGEEEDGKPYAEEDVDDDVEQYHSSLRDKEDEQEVEEEEIEQGPPKALPYPPSSRSKHNHDEYQEDEFEQSYSSMPGKPSRGQAAVGKPSSRAPPQAVPSSSSHHAVMIPRIPYKSIYDSIFIAKDEVPLDILLKQLRAMLKLHGYSDEDISHFIDLEKKSAAVNPQEYHSMSSAKPPSTTSSVPSKASSNSRLAVSRSAQAHTTSSNDYNLRDDASVNSNNSMTRQKPSQADLQLDLPGGQPVVHSGRRSNTPRRGETSSSSSLAMKQQQEKEQQLLAAKNKLEEDARQRKARQEAARQFREEQESQKKKQVNDKRRSTTPTNNKRLSAAAPSVAPPSSGMEEDFSNFSITPRSFERASVTEHSEEIQRLSSILDVDKIARHEEKLSMAKKFGIKKQIALHKAAILKAQRAKSSPNSSHQMADDGSNSAMEDADPNNPFIARKPVKKPTGSERYGTTTNFRADDAPSESYDADGYVISGCGRPLNNRMAQKLTTQQPLPEYQEPIREEPFVEDRMDFQTYSTSNNAYGSNARVRIGSRGGDRDDVPSTGPGVIVTKGDSSGVRGRNIYY